MWMCALLLGVDCEGSEHFSLKPLQDLTSRCLSLSDLTGSVTVKIADEGT